MTALLDPRLQKLPVHRELGEAAILVPDTNIILHHLDVLERSQFVDVVVLQTVLDEVRNQNPGTCTRVRNAISNVSKRFYVFSNELHRETFVEKTPHESDNDRNDRAIRVATQWYQKHLQAQPDPLCTYRVVLLTNDRDNAAKAADLALPVYSLHSYCQGLADAGDLLDMIEKPRDDEEKSQLVYPEEHLSPGAMHAQLQANQIIRGTLHVNAYNCFEGSVATDLAGEMASILIKGRVSMNRAVNGDIVVVGLLPREQWSSPAKDTVASEEPVLETVSSLPAVEAVPKELHSTKPSGKVLGIIRRNWKPYCGSIDRKSIKAGVAAQSVLFVPMDHRTPRIRLFTRQAENLAGQRILVSIDSWERSSLYPHGHLVRQLGPAGDKAIETEAILIEHDVSYQEFTPQVLACLPAAGPDYVATAEDHAGRADFRALDVCSIDPPGCTDIDDALHATRLPNGNYTVGVHIADVTHFVKAGTPLDLEASSRATTVYLVDRRIDMLPPLLGTNLCSLKCNVERLAFSCVWEVTPDADVVSTHFTKSTICSKASFTYDEAQARLEDPNAKDALSQSIKILNQLAKRLKQKRVAAGALTLASPEVRFSLDTDTMNPVDVELKEMKDANSLVEEFMLLANISVASELCRSFPETAVLRRHPAPPADNFDALNKALERRHCFLDVSSSKKLAESLDAVVDAQDPYFNKLIRIMTTRCMLQAVYFASGSVGPEQFWHYGLATPIYTHFTSPIRRYADVLVHRLLHASIDAKARGSAVSWSQQQLEDVCQSTEAALLIACRHELSPPHGAAVPAQLDRALYASFLQGKDHAGDGLRRQDHAERRCLPHPQVLAVHLARILQVWNREPGASARRDSGSISVL